MHSINTCKRVLFHEIQKMCWYAFKKERENPVNTAELVMRQHPGNAAVTMAAYEQEMC